MIFEACRPLSNDNIGIIGLRAIVMAMDQCFQRGDASALEFERAAENALYEIFNCVQQIRIDIIEGILRNPDQYTWLLKLGINLYIERQWGKSLEDFASISELVLQGSYPDMIRRRCFVLGMARGKRTIRGDMHPDIIEPDFSLDGSEPDPGPDSDYFEVPSDKLESFLQARGVFTAIFG